MAGATPAKVGAAGVPRPALHDTREAGMSTSKSGCDECSGYRAAEPPV